MEGISSSSCLLYFQTRYINIAEYRGWFIPDDVTDLRRFLCAGYMHNSSYLGGVLPGHFMLRSNSGQWTINPMDVRDGYSISCERALQQDERIHAYLAGSYWAEGIPLALVRRSLDHSLCVGVFWGGRQVAFARVISDRATFAYLCDVYVLEEHRRKGLSAWMLEVITAHPELQGLRRFVLATRDAHRLYAKFGFTPLSAPDSLMEIVKSGLYQKPVGPAPEPDTTPVTIPTAGKPPRVGPS